MRSMVWCLIAVVAGGLYGCGDGRHDDSMLARTFVTSSGDTLPYRIFIPGAPNAGTHRPLVLFLHGGTGSGVDNAGQISGANRPGVRLWIKADNQARHPCFVLAPQLPPYWRWDSVGHRQLSRYADAVVQLLAELKKEFLIDENRVYLTGQSLGGWGTWDLIVKRSGLFAAAVPVCGGGDPNAVTGFENIAVWAFHGRLDSQIPVEHSRKMVEALRKSGATVRYTEYESLGHSIWNKAYAEPELVDWMFSKHRVQ